MANAVTTAPETKVKTITIGEGDFEEKVIEGSVEHKALSMVFDTEIKYVFELAARNPAPEMPTFDARTNRPIPHKQFKPFQNVVMTSQVVWNKNRRTLRYYDGCTTIFADKQPKDREMLDQLIKQTTQRHFDEGKLIVYGYEKMLLLYLSICSWNTESPFRTKTASGIFVPVDAGKKAQSATARIDQMEKALKMAKEASDTKMFIHCDYLGIPMIDYDSGNEMSVDEIRAEYRNEAARNPETFITSFGNKAIEAKYFIDKALKEGVIKNNFNPNKATWGSSNTEICDISGLRSTEAISQRLFEYSQSEDGAEFLIQLRAIFEK